MPTTEVLPVESGPQAGDEAMCAACPHPLDGHDRICARYCSATISGGLDRTCLCDTAVTGNYRR
ncbi:MAG TPA: RGCVC family protein [Pseudonocardiaceae bacterium]|nr:RGCVC family protein [Pseudonocardiaceae bacterium]